MKAFLACIVVETFFKAEAKAFIFHLVNIYLISQVKMNLNGRKWAISPRGKLPIVLTISN